MRHVQRPATLRLRPGPLSSSSYADIALLLPGAPRCPTGPATSGAPHTAPPQRLSFPELPSLLPSTRPSPNLGEAAACKRRHGPHSACDNPTPKAMNTSVETQPTTGKPLGGATFTTRRRLRRRVGGAFPGNSPDGGYRFPRPHQGHLWDEQRRERCGVDLDHSPCAASVRAESRLLLAGRAPHPGCPLLVDHESSWSLIRQ